MSGLPSSSLDMHMCCVWLKLYTLVSENIGLSTREQGNVGFFYGISHSFACTY